LQVLKKQIVKQFRFIKIKTLIYEAYSATELVKQINISYSTVIFSLRNPSKKKIFKYFNISYESPTPEIEIKKVEAQILKNLINEYCSIDQRTKNLINPLL
jgi:hypothetical protein